MLPGYDYDFEMTIRSDEQFTRSVERQLVESCLMAFPGVRRSGDRTFVLDSPLDRWMDLVVEFRRWDGMTGERVEPSGLANCVFLRIPASVRGPDKERDYYALAFAIADRLGWMVFDDTDSGCRLDVEWLDRHFPTQPKAPKPWWKIF